MKEKASFTNEQLDYLRAEITKEISGKRYFHTLGVEREIEWLAQLYCPESTSLLRAAALLHDITKEYTPEEHFSVMQSYGIDTDEYKSQNRKVYHSLTASLIIADKFGEFADSELVHAVRVHTTGCADMSLSDKLLYLADYIEDTRTFDDCVKLRHFFWEGIERGEDKYAWLNKTLILSFDMTLRDLIEQGEHISKNTVEARNFLIIGE